VGTVGEVSGDSGTRTHGVTRSVSKFFNFGQTREIGPVLPSLTDFEFLTRFHTLYTCRLVKLYKLYNFTSQIAILTTLLQDTRPEDTMHHLPWFSAVSQSIPSSFGLLF
jgi:hypothetical protein